MGRDRPPRTAQARRMVAQRRAEREAIDDLVTNGCGPVCGACAAGVHDPKYGEDGICRCECCGEDLTEDGYPCLNLT